MKPNQLATLVLRLMGIYCLIHVLPTLSLFWVTTTTYMRIAESPAQFRVLMGALFPGISYLISGILLLVFSGVWGGKLTQDLDNEGIAAISAEQIQVLVFAVAGILIFASALPQVVNSITFLFGRLTAGNDTPRNLSVYYDTQGVLSSFGVLVKAGLGLALFFRARGFANFWRSLRMFATPKPPSE